MKTILPKAKKAKAHHNTASRKAFANARAKRLNVPAMHQRRQKLQPPPSQDAYFNAARPTPTGNQAYGGYSGCAYRGGDAGVVCMRNMNRYTPDTNFWTGNWTSNVDVQFPAPVVETGGGAMQALRGGGTEYKGNACTDACACSAGNVDCACAPNKDKCGWIAVNHDCIGAVPHGMYASLSACEDAHSYGFYKP